jgi:hypothetical protein
MPATCGHGTKSLLMHYDSGTINRLHRNMHTSRMFTGTRGEVTVPGCRRGKVAHHEGEDAEVDEEGKQEHTHGAYDVVQKRYLLSWVEEHLIEAAKIYCTDLSQQSDGTKMDDNRHACSESNLSNQIQDKNCKARSARVTGHL